MLTLLCCWLALAAAVTAEKSILARIDPLPEDTHD